MRTLVVVMLTFSSIISILMGAGFLALLPDADDNQDFILLVVLAGLGVFVAASCLAGVIYCPS